MFNCVNRTSGKLSDLKLLLIVYVGSLAVNYCYKNLNAVFGREASNFFVTFEYRCLKKAKALNARTLFHACTANFQKREQNRIAGF
jgi:hypothetical protein